MRRLRSLPVTVGARAFAMRRRYSRALVLLATLAVSGLVAAAAQAETTAGTWANLVTDVAAGGTVQLGADIPASDSAGENLVVGSNPVTLDLDGHDLSITSPSDSDAAIEVPADDSLTIEDSSGGGVLTATGGYAGAGIGGDGYVSPDLNGETPGSITIDSGVVDATGGELAAGIGGGAGDTNGGSGGTVLIDGGTVIATGGGDEPGIGGGEGISGLGGAGASVTIESGAQVTASAPPGVSAIGGGYGGTTDGVFGSLSNSSATLTIPSGAELDVPSDVTVDNETDGEFDIAGTLGGDGTVQNDGVIQVSGTVSGNGDGNGMTGLLIEPDNYALSFDDNGGSGPTPGPEYVYADTVKADGLSLPASPTLPAGATTFEGWYTAATGGTRIRAMTDLVTEFPAGPVPETLFAQYVGAVTLGTQPGDASVSAGQTATFSASATGYPAPTVQWQSSTDGGTSWQNVAGATSTTLTLSDVTVSRSGTEYRAVFTNSNSSQTTGAATLTVAPLAQAISFTPLAGQASAGSSARLAATGGGSGQPVEFSVGSGTSPADACSVTQSGSGAGTVSYAHVGTCVIDANQAASSDGNYTAAATASQTVTIGAVASTVALSSPAATVYGQPSTVTATVTEAGGSPASGTVQFTVNGADLGAPVTLVAGVATSVNLTAGLAPGSYQVGAVFTPSDASVYGGGSATAVTQVIDRAATSSTVTVGAGSVTARVTPVSPGAGSPAGSVSFSVDGQTVGSAPVSGGTATLDHTVPAGKRQSIAAVYSGDSDFSGSSASTSRSDPTITAHLSSSEPKSRDGWYRTAVKVSFSCRTAGAALIGGCPGAVTLTRDGAAQSLTRTIKARNGGAATVTVRGIDIDKVPPRVKVSGGVGAGTGARCVAHDSLSGVASCKLTRRVVHSSSGLDETTVTVTATASDRAGNRAVSTRTYRTPGIYVEAATYSDGAFQITLGRSYTVVVTSASAAPRYVDAGPNPPGPYGLDNAFHSIGHGAWAIGVNFATAMDEQRTWQFGVLVGGAVHVVTVHTT